MLLAQRHFIIIHQPVSDYPTQWHHQLQSKFISFHQGRPSPRLFISLGVRGHVAGQMVPLAEGFAAHGAAKLLFSGASLLVLLLAMVRAHVVDEVGRHAETDPAERAHILTRVHTGEGRQQRSPLVLLLLLLLVILLLLEKF